MRRAGRDLAQLAAFHRWVERHAEVAAAPEGQVSYLASRDEHLLSLKVLRVHGHRPVQIVGPRAFLRLLNR